jgi:hypothetical protein
MTRYDTSENDACPYLANGKMAEPTNELALVQRISRLLHTTHRDHRLIVFK